MKKWRQDELDYFQFEHDRDRLNSNILMTAGLVKNQMMEWLAPFDLTLAQYQALQILNLQNGKAISTLHLRERMLDKMSDTPKIVDRLLKKGLVQKNTSKADRRLVDICINSAGVHLLEKIRVNLALGPETSSSLTQKDVEALNSLLCKIRLAPPKKKRKG